ncbi:hypothetical protein GCM10008961_31390 [Deinococcus knuensis]|uniref:Uncharacterized protein n=1 Tax=Deinococcus knuensis TaxID=1837380 RepID=A0ABQ2STG9_9DEIO|nr:hypothetical protein GCM10008961_31390 [Deinococcus knuensis]
MEFARKPARRPGTHTNQQTHSTQPFPEQAAPSSQRDLQAFLRRPVQLQRRVAQPALRAAHLLREDERARSEQRATLQRQAQHPETSPVPPPLRPHEVPTRPAQPAEWVTVMRFQAQQAQDRALSTREWAQFTALQRQVAAQLGQAYRQDSSPGPARQDAMAAHLLSLQRHPLSAPRVRGPGRRVHESESPVEG